MREQLRPQVVFSKKVSKMTDQSLSVVLIEDRHKTAFGKLGCTLASFFGQFLQRKKPIFQKIMLSDRA